MLELRPICENCAKALPPNTTDAMICTFECTFCADCVERVLDNVCPNCGGAFSPRPIRPKINWRDDNYLGKYPASERSRHRSVNVDEHAKFAAPIRKLAPKDR